MGCFLSVSYLALSSPPPTLLSLGFPLNQPQEVYPQKDEPTWLHDCLGELTDAFLKIQSLFVLEQAHVLTPPPPRVFFGEGSF